MVFDDWFYDAIKKKYNQTTTIYIPSKGRSSTIKTTDYLDSIGLNYKVVVEKNDYDAYRSRFSADQLLTLDQENKGITYVRNWIKDHSTSIGEKYHWQLDDDIKKMYDRNVKPKKIMLDGSCFGFMEHMMDVFDNLAIAGFAHDAFAFTKSDYVMNRQLASCALFRNETPVRWEYNIIEDLDYSFQTLLNGYSTIEVALFSYLTVQRGKLDGGNLNDFESGKLLARNKNLQNKYPNWVSLKINDKLSNVRIKPGAWKTFDNPLMKEDTKLLKFANT